jgi:hypothetical protein
MASEAAKQQAIKIVDDKLGSLSGEWGYWWPFVHRLSVINGLKDRVHNPNRIWQSQANICGMASFANSLASTDPVMYTWFAAHLFRNGAAKLGRKSEAIVISPSVETRSARPPLGMAYADWLVLASLRDHLNAVIHYSTQAKVPIVEHIPLVRIFSWAWLAEPIAGITMPGGMEDLLRAAGYRNVVDYAGVQNKGIGNFESAGKYYSNNYEVFLFISSDLFSGGSRNATPDHWVRLASEVDDDMFAFGDEQGFAARGVSFAVFDPAIGAIRHVPDPSKKAKYLRAAQLLDHYYGFVAGRPK